MEAADWHTYQVLTKRSSLMADTSEAMPTARHPQRGAGVSVEDGATKSRTSICERYPSLLGSCRSNR